MSRLWTEGEAIAVQADESGAPMRLTWQGQWHDVQAVAESWRVDEGWWAKRVWRTYFKVITDSGLLLLIYHDLPAGAWFVQRLYD